MYTSDPVYDIDIPEAAASFPEITKYSTMDELHFIASERALAELRAVQIYTGKLPTPRQAGVRMTRWTQAAERNYWRRVEADKKKPGDARHVSLAQPRPAQAAALMMLYYTVIVIPTGEGDEKREEAMLAVYDHSTGLFVESGGASSLLTVFLRKMVFGADKKWIAEVQSALKDIAPLRYQTEDPDLVPLEDCIYRMSTEERLEYDPDEFVFLAKARTRLPETEPELPRIQNPDGTWWDPETWLLEMMGTPGLVRMIHEVNNHLVRTRAFTDDKVVLYFSDSGNNGKGTTLVLQRALVGGRHSLGVASLPIEKFSGPNAQFAMTALLGAVANLSDESDGEAFHSSSGTLKALSSHDPVFIDRKNRDGVMAKLFVPLVFSVNRLPKVKDKSEALLRRLLIITFGARFMSDGTTPIVKNGLIKQDYVLRDEVREWFMWQALKVVGPITEFSAPDEVTAAVTSYREENDPIAGFWEKYGARLEESALTKIPFQMLYDAYVAHSISTRGKGAGIEGDKEFYKRLSLLATAGGVWRDEWNSDLPGRRRIKRSWDWSAEGAQATRFVFAELGMSTMTKKDFGMGSTYYESIIGEKNMARWTRTEMPAGVVLAAPLIPDRGYALVRESAPVAATVPAVVAPAPTQQPTPAGFAEPYQGPILPPSAAGASALFEQWMPANPPPQPAYSSSIDACQITPAYEG